MPYINVKIAGDLSIKQKRVIADEMSDTILKVTGKPKQNCYIVFDEINRDNWAKGADILSDIDRKTNK